MAKKTQQEGQSTFESKIQELEKKFGSGSVISGTNMKESLEVVPSGSLGIDVASNCGGIPVGKLIEMLGMESSGKSTVTLHIMAEFQKAYPNDKVVLIDYEQAFDRSYAEKLKIDMSKLVVCQPSCQEDGYNLAEELIKTGVVRLVVKDSHTAAMPRKVVDGETGDASIGLQARINSQGLGKIKPLLKDNRCTVIGISQIRQNVGGYGDINQSTGGLSWKFYSDMRMKFNKSVDKEGESNKTTVEIIKNKCGCPFGKAEFRINWGTGIDKMQEIIDAAVEFKLILKGAAGWYTIEQGEGEEKVQIKLQGDNKVKEFLRDNDGYAQLLESEVLQRIKQI
jgi:recombination protein RecA